MTEKCRAGLCRIIQPSLSIIKRRILSYEYELYPKFEWYWIQEHVWMTASFVPTVLQVNINMTDCSKFHVVIKTKRSRNSLLKCCLLIWGNAKWYPADSRLLFDADVLHLQIGDQICNLLSRFVSPIDSTMQRNWKRNPNLRIFFGERG